MYNIYHIMSSSFFYTSDSNFYKLFTFIEAFKKYNSAFMEMDFINLYYILLNHIITITATMGINNLETNRTDTVNNN